MTKSMSTVTTAVTDWRMAGQYDGKPVRAPWRTHARATRATMTPAQACRGQAGEPVKLAAAPSPVRAARDLIAAVRLADRAELPPAPT